jgi:phosphoglucomutase
MTILRCPISPFNDQKPGTSGLRRPTRVFSSPGYLESFLQAIFEADPPPPGAALVVGGDGRYFADTAAETTARMALANGYARVIIGRGGLMSTPAVSALIRASLVPTSFPNRKRASATSLSSFEASNWART